VSILITRLLERPALIVSRPRKIYDREIVAETVAAAFTDHHAVTLKLEGDVRILRQGRGIRKLNVAILNEADCKVNLSHEWE
jgi:hypothetical protein